MADIIPPALEYYRRPHFSIKLSILNSPPKNQNPPSTPFIKGVEGGFKTYFLLNRTGIHGRQTHSLVNKPRTTCAGLWSREPGAEAPGVVNLHTRGRSR